MKISMTNCQWKADSMASLVTKNGYWQFLFAFGCALVLLVAPGCQTGLSGLPNLSTLNSPTRVPPPSTGTYSQPNNYGPGNLTSGTPLSSQLNAAPTMAGLRSLETGKSAADSFGYDGWVSADVSDRTVAARPVMTAPKSKSDVVNFNLNDQIAVGNQAFSEEGSVVPASVQIPIGDDRAAVTALSDSSIFSGRTKSSHASPSTASDNPATEQLRWRAP